MVACKNGGGRGGEQESEVGKEEGMLLKRERAFDGWYVVVAGLGIVDIRMNDSHPYRVP